VWFSELQFNFGPIKNKVRERAKLTTKKWNPYCIRHSAITADSDYLPEYALKKKARWSMNSKQGSRYIKRRMGDDLKNQILARNGIISEESVAAQRKPSVLTCARCSLVNAVDNKFCSKCSYPLTPQAYEEIKELNLQPIWGNKGKKHTQIIGTTKVDYTIYPKLFYRMREKFKIFINRSRQFPHRS